jgi:sugar phosphate isomerase/epimerase
MDRVLSTHLMSNHRLTSSLLDRIGRAGIPAVEIFCARQHFDYRDEGQIQELAYWFDESELKLQSVHAPIYTDAVWGRSGPHAVITITEPVKIHRITMVDEIKRAIEVAERIPFRYLIAHIGVGGEEYEERKLDAAFSSLEELKNFAGQRGVEILLENIPNGFSSAERLLMFLQVTHLNLGLAFDVGHAHMGAGVEHEFAVMRDRIRSTHVHDNDGRDDSHLFPMVSEGGTVDWPAAMRALGSRPGQYPLVLELREPAGMKNPIEAAIQSFEKLENLLK